MKIRTGANCFKADCNCSEKDNLPVDNSTKEIPPFHEDCDCYVELEEGECLGIHGDIIIQIKTLSDLRLAVLNKKAVIVPNSRAWKKPCPAGFMINLPGAILIRLFDSGMFIYEKGMLNYDTSKHIKKKV